MSEDEIGVDVVIENEEGSVEIKSDVLKGDKGEKGDPTATIEINQVITGEAGTNAKIENVGTDVNLKLDITIPQGDKGEQGEIGADGYTPIKGTDYFTEAEIQQIKSDILADVSSFDLEVVTTLPTENIKEKTIYLVPNSKQSEKNIYDECIYVNNNWEYIGATETDLSNYYNRTEVDTKIDSLNELLSSKADKVDGKGLSSNDFTDTYKSKLDGIATGATKNIVENSLSSTSTANALSAAQGKALNDKYNGTSLYDNSSGTTGTITLSQSAANFSYIEIHFMRTTSSGTNNYGFQKVYAPNGKQVTLSMNRYSSNTVLQVSGKVIKISGTSITVVGYLEINLLTDYNLDGADSTDKFKIVKVVGYK